MFASLNQAIQMFQVDKGRFPKDLNELVSEKLINSVPDAPYGMKLDYDATTGGRLVWCRRSDSARDTPKP